MKNLIGLQLGHGWNKDLFKKRFCLICQKEFGYPSCDSRKKTCSWECRSQLIREKRALQVITLQHRKAISEGLIGKPKSKEHIAKITGVNNYHWKGGLDNPLKRLRSSFAYKQWRKMVFKRDYWTCQICGVKGKTIWADHIKPFLLYPESRFDINNGRTVCKECALKLPTHGSRVYNFNYNQGHS